MPSGCVGTKALRRGSAWIESSTFISVIPTERICWGPVEEGISKLQHGWRTCSARSQEAQPKLNHGSSLA